MIHVLIPTDFSANSLNALTYAHMLFQDTKTEFTLFHTYEPTAVQLVGNQSPLRLSNVYASLKAQAIEKLDDLKAQILLKNEIPHHSYKTIAYAGHLMEGIKSIDPAGYNFIVMGSKGATGLRELFLGSNTYDVIASRPHIPILLIPEKASFQVPDTIGFATDFTRDFKKEELEPLLQLTKLWTSTLRLIEVYDVPKLTPTQKNHLQELERLLEDIEYRFHVIPKFSSLENCINVFDNELEVDMLVMIDYPKNFFERMMREPIIKKMSFHTTLPFLILPAHN